MQPIGLFGGTFDPVHYGHLLPVLEAAQALGLSEVRFVPAAQPPHRALPAASPNHRLNMLELALAERPDFAAVGFRLDDRELRRGGPSYTVVTLESVRAEIGAQPLCLIMGVDAFLGLPGWHRWQELIQVAHLVVMQRPGWAVAALPAWATERLARDRRELEQGPAGRLWFQDVTPQDLSSTRIRERLAQGGSVRGLMPETVREYIERHGLYR